MMDMAVLKDVVINHKKDFFTVGMIEESRYFQQNTKGNHYAPVYDSRAFDYLVCRAKKRVKNRFDNRIVTAGPPRTGKTTAAGTWARKIDPDFSVENVSFRLADFRADLASLPAADPEHDKFPIAVLDESGVDLFAKDWYTKVAKDMAKVFQICGKKRLTMFLNLPHRNFLTRDMRNEMHFWLNTCLEDEYRGYCEVREAKPNPWDAPYWAPLFGVVFEEMSGKWWNEYEKRKDEFIEKFISVGPITIPERVQKLLKQRNSLIRDLAKRGVSYRTIEGICGVGTGSISAIINRHVEELEEIS